MLVVDGPAVEATVLAGAVFKTTGTIVAVATAAGEDVVAGLEAGVVGFAGAETTGLVAAGVVLGGIGFPVNAASMRVVACSIESRAETILSTFKFDTPLLIPLYHFFFVGGAATGTAFDSLGAGVAVGFCGATEAGAAGVASFDFGGTAAAGVGCGMTFGAVMGTGPVVLEASTFAALEIIAMVGEGEAAVVEGNVEV